MSYMKKRSLVLVLCLSMMMWMVPTGTYGLGETDTAGDIANGSILAGRSLPTDKSDSEPAYAEGQVVVLFEEGAVTGENEEAAQKDGQENKSNSKKSKSRRASIDKVPKAKRFGSAMESAAENGAEEAENTLLQQADILEDALGSDYVIEDTIIIEDPAASGSSEVQNPEGNEPESDDADDSESSAREDASYAAAESNEIVISIVSSESLTTEEMVKKLNKIEGIKVAEPNYKFHMSAIPDWNDTYLEYAWQNGDKGVNADDVWGLLGKESASGSVGESASGAESGAEGADPVVIAVMDTGINFDHPDLKNRLWTMPENIKAKGMTGEHGYDFVYYDTDAKDENGHGSHCAGIIAAEANNAEGVVGVAGNAANVQLMSARILDEDGSGYLESIVSAFNYLIRAKNLGVDIKAVNCSFRAAVKSDVFDEVIEKAGQSGILTIAAAGNEMADNDTTDSAPANCRSDYVISVAALDDNGELASYSNYGSTRVDIAAPGSNILSSVSYDNYTPYLYDSAKLKETTEYYGGFTGAEIKTTVAEDGTEIQTITPVRGVDINGDPISEDTVGAFGESVLVSNTVDGSEGKAELELVSDNGFPIGRNKESLRWNITGAKEGDVFVLYFPYEKTASGDYDTYTNMVFRSYTDPENGGMGALDFGDIAGYIDKNGNFSYDSASQNSEFGFGYWLPVSVDYNSIWQASGNNGLLLKPTDIKDVNNKLTTYSQHEGNAAEESTEAAADVNEETPEEIVDEPDEEVTAEESVTEDAQGDEPATEEPATETPTEEPSTEIPAEEEPEAEEAADGTEREAVSSFGLGFVYTAAEDGDVSLDISSLGISKVKVNTEKFGQYDVYSGTSMATPAVTGSIGLLAALDPELNADQLRDKLYQTTSGDYDDICSTGGKVDFAEYTVSDLETGEDTQAKPALGKTIIDFDEDTITIEGKNFGAEEKPAVTVRLGSRPDDEQPVNEIDPENILSWDNNKIVIRDTEHALFGSDVTFKVTNASNGKNGKRRFYTVNGLKDYSDLFTGHVEEEDDFFFDWSKSSSKASSSSTKVSNYVEDELIPRGLVYIKGANRYLLYNSDSLGIYELKKDSDTKDYYTVEVGKDINTALKAYAKKKMDLDDPYNNPWTPDDPESLETDPDSDYYDEEETPYISAALMGEPVYMGDTVYELLNVSIDSYRQSFVLTGLNLNNKKWTIYYDSITDFGSADESLKFSELAETTLAGYKGKLYLLGNAVYTDGEPDKDTGVKPSAAQKTTYVCTPNAKGTKWVKSSDMVAATKGGKAIGQGGDLYYFFGKDDESETDQNVYKFNGKEWSTAGKLPRAIYKGGDEVTLYGDIFETSSPKAPCAYGIDDQGIVFAGASFDGGGDTCRFNTSTGKTEVLGYTLWGDIADRSVDGTIANGKLLVQYEIEDGLMMQAKSLKLKSGYIKVTAKITGKGKGTVTGTGSYPKGESGKVTITPKTGSYVYSIKTTGLKKNFNKKYGKITKRNKKAFKSSFTGKKNAAIKVNFGKKSTKIIAKNQTVKVGRNKLKGRTNGTVSKVIWKSSNRRYARVNKNGTVTFWEAARGKTVKMTAIAKDNRKLKKTIKVKVK